MKQIEVKLSPVECKVAAFVGKWRNRLSLETKQNRRRDSTQTDEDMNIEAVGAEMATAKWLNVYPELSPTDGELPKWDLIYMGKKIDVKRNHLRDGDLLVPFLNTDVTYLLVCGSMPSYWLTGWLPGQHVEALGRWEDLSRGPCWKVTPDRLINITHLTDTYRRGIEYSSPRLRLRSL
jgi:hypothetical protein